MTDFDAALVQKILNIPEQQREPDAEHHRKADELRAGFECQNGLGFVIRQNYETSQPVSSQFPLKMLS